MQNKKIATALKYNRSMKAPQVQAKGESFIAEKIIEIAKKSGIPIVKDPYLAKALYSCKVNTPIPEQLYHVVAEIMRYIDSKGAKDAR